MNLQAAVLNECHGLRGHRRSPLETPSTGRRTMRTCRLTLGCKPQLIEGVASILLSQKQEA